MVKMSLMPSMSELLELIGFHNKLVMSVMSVIYEVWRVTYMFTPNLRYPIHCANSLHSSTISQPSHTTLAIHGPMVLSLLKEALVRPCGPAHDASIVHFEARFIWTQALFQHLKFLHQTSALTDAVTGHFFLWASWDAPSRKMLGKKGPNKLRLSGLHNITYLGMSRNGLDLHPIYGYLDGGYDDQPSKLRYPVTNPPASVCKNHGGVKACPPLQDHEIQSAFTTSWSFTTGVYSNHPQSIRSSLLKGFHRSLQSWVHPYLNWPWSSLNINQLIYLSHQKTSTNRN